MQQDCNQPGPEKRIKTAMLVSFNWIIDIAFPYSSMFIADFEQVFAHMGSIILTTFWAMFYSFLCRQKHIYVSNK